MNNTDGVTGVGMKKIEGQRRSVTYFFFLPAFLAFFLAGFFLAMDLFLERAAQRCTQNFHVCEKFFRHRFAQKNAREKFFSDP